ncbi:hypothetical protein MTBLM1_40245 [Rhodospirillaceae bacterium LM-1]|nr:hypothetical protein MTBLM1_40245 [Rhodospirillaceae bacterium LM-1]
MPTKFVVSLIDRVLASPKMFEMHQTKINHYEDIASEFSEFLAVGGQKILDIGCSTGTCASQIIDFARNDYTGIDIHPGYTEAAAKRFANAKFLPMDARSLSFGDASFNLVVIVGVLHHVPDDIALAAMREAARVVKPDGHILVAEPVFTPGRWISNFLNHLDRGRFIRSPEEYRKLLGPVRIERERFFDLDVTFCVHRLLSFVVRPN